MTYTSVIREVYTRLDYFAKAGRSLEGMKVIRTRNFKISDSDSLPSVTIIDTEINSAGGTTSGLLSMFVRSKREHDLISLESDDKLGLYEWVELIQNAVTTCPFGNTDSMLRPHRLDGTKVLDQHDRHAELLSGSVSWSGRMVEINDLAYTFQLDLSWKLADHQFSNRAQVLARRVEYAIPTQ